MTNTNDESLKHAVRERYGAVAQQAETTAGEPTRRVAQAFGYDRQELESIPATANMGLSCGNPTAIANLKEGETVVDLGCGGGLDVLLAAHNVGPQGRVIGIDMTDDMVQLARRNATKAGATNVEIHRAEIESLPLPSESVDCVISNCVINLVPNKERALSEIFRVLRPGGRLAISDIALKQPLPEEIGQDLMAYIGCIAGAILIDEYVALLHAAGFQQVRVEDSHADLNAYALLAEGTTCCAGAPLPSADETATDGPSLPIAATGCCGPASEETSPANTSAGSEQDSLHKRLAELTSQYDINRYAASVKVLAMKPAGAS